MKNLQISLAIFWTMFSTAIIGSEQKFTIHSIRSSSCELTGKPFYTITLRKNKQYYTLNGYNTNKHIASIIAADLAKEERASDVYRIRENLEGTVAQIAYEQTKRARHEQLLAHCAKTTAEEKKEEGLSIVIPVQTSSSSSRQSSSAIKKSTKSFANMDALGKEDLSNEVGPRK